MSQSLTQLAHTLAREVIREGDVAIDATAGNGHDTAFLAEAVGKNGRVFAFDIQQAAITVTRQRLSDAGLVARVTLILDGHENMRRHLPAENSGTVSAAFFNLGYLPRGDHAVITRGETTLAALDQAAEFLRGDGHLSLLVYPAHAGGAEEADVVKNWIQARVTAGEFSFQFHGDAAQNLRPWLAVGKKVRR